MSRKGCYWTGAARLVIVENPPSSLRSPVRTFRTLSAGSGCEEKNPPPGRRGDLGSPVPRQYAETAPPSTRMFWPVTYVFAGAHRKAHRRANSSGRP